MSNEQSNKIYPGIRSAMRPYDGVVTGICCCKVWATVPAVLQWGTRARELQLWKGLARSPAREIWESKYLR